MTVKRVGETPVIITRKYTGFTANITVIALNKILQDLREANTSNGWNIIILIITVIVSLVHPIMGIIWLFVLTASNVLELYIVVAGIFAMIGGILIRG